MAAEVRRLPLIAYEDGDGNAYGGFACYIGSGWAQDSLSLKDGEIYDLNYPSTANDPDDDPVIGKVMQYIRGTSEDDLDSGTVTFTGEVRYLKQVPNEPKHN